MQKVTLVRGARQLLTLRGPNGPRRGADLGNPGLIQDGAVLIVDGVIREVGPTRRLENLALARTAEEIDATGRVVLPGFVDPHMHAVSGPARPPEDGIGVPGNDRSEMAQAIARTIRDHSPRAAETMALRVLEDAVRHGTTTFGLQSGFGLTVAGEEKILRVHRALGRRAISVVSTYASVGVPEDYEARQDEYLQWIAVRLLTRLRHRGLAEFAAIRCGEGSFTLAQACRYFTAARELGLLLKLDAGLGLTPETIALAVQMGAISVALCMGATEEDARLLGESETIAILLPGFPFYLRNECYPEARRLIDGGAAVALATGYNPITSPTQSMPAMIGLAWREMRLTPAEAIAAATINAAHALGRGDRVGSIEAGKIADLLILGVPDYRELPYHFGVNLVDLVIKNGTVVVKRPEVQWPAQ